jgi:small subunit ribosomal protein S1
MTLFDEPENRTHETGAPPAQSSESHAGQEQPAGSTHPTSERPNEGPTRAERDNSNMEDFAAALAAFETEKEKEQAALEDNRILKGTVVDITPTHAIVHVGTKSDGMVPVAELKDHEGNLKFKATRLM